MALFNAKTPKKPAPKKTPKKSADDDNGWTTVVLRELGPVLGSPHLTMTVEQSSRVRADGAETIYDPVVVIRNTSLPRKLQIKAKIPIPLMEAAESAFAAVRKEQARLAALAAKSRKAG
jgi:hypothetical protein